MAAPLNRVLTNIVTPTETWKEVSIQIPPARATALVRRRREIIAEVPGVTAVARVAPGEWQVTFEDGTIWSVTDAPQPCGCG